MRDTPIRKVYARGAYHDERGPTAKVLLVRNMPSPNLDRGEVAGQLAVSAQKRRSRRTAVFTQRDVTGSCDAPPAYPRALARRTNRRLTVGTKTPDTVETAEPVALRIATKTAAVVVIWTRAVRGCETWV